MNMIYGLGLTLVITQLDTDSWLSLAPIHHPCGGLSSHTGELVVGSPARIAHQRCGEIPASEHEDHAQHNQDQRHRDRQVGRLEPQDDVIEGHQQEDDPAPLRDRPHIYFFLHNRILTFFLRAS